MSTRTESLSFAKSDASTSDKMDARAGGFRLALALPFALASSLMACEGDDGSSTVSGPIGESALAQISPPAPRDRHAAFARNATSLAPVPAEQYNAIVSQNGPDNVSLSLNAGGKLEYGHGTDLLNSACVASVSPFPRYSSDWLNAAVRCFLRSNHALFLDEAADLDFAFLELTEVGDGMNPGEKMVKVDQRHAGLPVFPAGLKFFFIEGRLAHVAGKVYDPRAFHPRPALNRSELEARARLSLNEGVRFYEERFDGDRNRFIFTVLDQEGTPPLYYDLDASTLELLETRPAAHGYKLGFNNNVSFSVHAYPDLYYSDPTKVNFRGAFVDGSNNIQYYTPPTSATVPLNVTCTSIDPSGNCIDNCTFSPGYPSNNSGFAQFDLPSTIYTAGANNTDVLVTAFSAICSNPFPSNPTYNFPQLRYEALSNYHWLYRVAQMKNHAWSYLNQGTYSQPRKLLLKVQDVITGGGGGIYTGFDSRISLEFWKTAATSNLSAGDLLVVAHEYGHHVHQGYGFQGTNALREGWADSFAYRWPVYGKQVTGDYPFLGYATPMFFVRSRTHDETFQTAQNGEYEILLAGGNNADVYYRGGTGCFSGGSFDENNGAYYSCSNPIPQIYWELAWNSCRLSYDTCTYGSSIASPINYGFTAWMLANSAFAFALSMTTSSSNVGSFLLSVNSRYNDFTWTYNYIGSASLSRVRSVLEHHCAGEYGWGGFDNACDKTLYNRLPGSYFASLYSFKAPGFAEGENLTRGGGTTLVTTNAADASAYKYASMPVTGWVQPTVTAGNHTFKLAMRRPTSSIFDGPIVVSYQSPSGPATYSTGTGLGITSTEWKWVNIPSLNSAQTTVTITNQGNGTAQLDAIWVQ